MLLALIAPILSFAFNLYGSVIIYSSKTPGIEIEGSLKQFGNPKKYTNEVVAKEKANFNFVCWSDGCLEPNRRDKFQKKDQTFDAYGRYFLNDANLIQFEKDRDVFAFSKPTKTNYLFYLPDNSFFESDATINKIANYENLKSQYKFDFFVHLSDSPFQTQNLEFKSMSNDKTFLHNYLAYELINTVTNQTQRKYGFVNLVFGATYNGLYLWLESFSDYLERTNNLKVDWEIIAMNSVGNQYVTYNNGNASFYVLSNNTTKTNEEICINAHEKLEELSEGIIDSFDTKSISLYLAINEYMKNNSNIENDLKIIKVGDKIYIDPFTSYSLSSPLFKWQNYSPIGLCEVNRFLLKSSKNMLIMEEKNRYIKEFVESELNIYRECKNSLVQFDNSINEDIKKWGLNNSFGLPEEYYQLNTRDEYLTLYEQWLEERILWLNGN